MLTTPSHDRELIRSQNRGSRVYSIDGEVYPSVTSVVSAGEPRPALIGWAKKVTAESAIASHDLVGRIIEQDGERAAIDHLKGAAYRQRNAAGDLGSRLHDVAEWEILEGRPYPEQSDPGAQALLEQFRNFVLVMDPEWHAVEAIVYNTEHRYAGTLDAIATLRPENEDLQGLANMPLLIDWKSGSGVYGSAALQLVAYAHSEHLIGPTGRVPTFDLLPSKVAAVVHITPKGWRLVEVDVSDETFAAFLNTKAMALWANGGGDAAVGRVLAHGRSTGGRSLTLKKQDDPGPEVDAVKDFGARRRIKPPVLSS